MNETILNHDYDFSKAPPDVQNAFIGKPQRTQLETGTRLFRLITTEDETRPGNGILTGQWWFDLATRQRLSQTAYRTGATLPAVTQSRLAVTRKFSAEMEYLCAIILKKPVFAWIGRARWQHDDALSVTLIGGFTQIFIPSLAVSGGGLSSGAAQVETFAYVLG